MSVGEKSTFSVPPPAQLPGDRTLAHRAAGDIDHLLTSRSEGNVISIEFNLSAVSMACVDVRAGHDVDRGGFQAAVPGNLRKTPEGRGPPPPDMTSHSLPNGGGGEDG